MGARQYTKQRFRDDDGPPRCSLREGPEYLRMIGNLGLLDRGHIQRNR